MANQIAVTLAIVTEQDLLNASDRPNAESLSPEQVGNWVAFIEGFAGGPAQPGEIGSSLTNAQAALEVDKKGKEFQKMLKDRLGALPSEHAQLREMLSKNPPLVDYPNVLMDARISG